MKRTAVLIFLFAFSLFVSLFTFSGGTFAEVGGGHDNCSYWGECPDSTDPDSSTTSSNKLTSPTFRFNPNNISPATVEYDQGSGNVTKLLTKIAQLLLVVVSTGAVLFIVVGGFYMVISGGDTEKANKGKIIITYNVIAICIAMLSYGIIQFVVWILWTPH